MGCGYGKAKLVVCKRYTNGNTIGTWNKNPLFDTSVYTINFDDGMLHEYFANLIA